MEQEQRGKPEASLKKLTLSFAPVPIEQKRLSRTFDSVEIQAQYCHDTGIGRGYLKKPPYFSRILVLR